MIEESKHIDPIEAQLIRFIEGACPADEAEKLYADILANASLRARYFALQKSMADFDQSYLEKAFDTVQAKNRFFETIGGQAKYDDGTLDKKTLPLWLKVAAAIIVLLIPALYLLLTPVQQNTILVAEQQQNITLPDSSQIWINSHSQLQYARQFGKKNRHAHLLGEAYFEVEANPEMPFIISTPNLQIKVIGTAFNVRNYAHDSSASISVSEGIVELYNPERCLLSTLRAGEEFNLNKHTLTWNKDSLQDANFLAWKTGILEFKHTRLRDVTQILSSHYDTSILLSDQELGDKQVYSTFKDESLDNVLEVLSFLHNLSILKQDSVVIISSKEQ